MNKCLKVVECECGLGTAFKTGYKGEPGTCGQFGKTDVVEACQFCDKGAMMKYD